MRVLHLLKTARGATWALRQMTQLRALGVDVVAAMPAPASEVAAAYRRAGVTVVPVALDFTLRRPWQLAGALRRCRELVATVRPDLVHSHFVSTTLVARLALGRGHAVPRLFQVPGPLHLEHPLPRALDLATAGPRDGWIASCRWTRDAYRRAGIPASGVFLSYYGTDLRPFDDARRGTLRRALAVRAETPLVGLVAWMYAPKRWLGQRVGLKGHETFFEALRWIAPRRPDVRGVVVGSAWIGAERYEQHLRELGRDVVRFTGARSDVPGVYRDLDLAVHPSRSENCGGAVESLAAACPTIASNVGGLPDVVVPDATGWLVPPDDPVALGEAILEALADPAEARRRARVGRRHVRRLFDVERTGREVFGIYQRVLGTTPAPRVRLAS